MIAAKTFGSFNPRTPCGVRRIVTDAFGPVAVFQSTHSLRSATMKTCWAGTMKCCFNPRTPCGVRHRDKWELFSPAEFQSTHSLRSATIRVKYEDCPHIVSIHALLAECDFVLLGPHPGRHGFNPRTPCGVRPRQNTRTGTDKRFQSTHSLRSATAPNLIHCYSTKQIILCANLPKKTVIARLLFLSIYLSIFYSQCITPIADLPGNSCELEVGAQAMFNSL